MQRCEKRSAIPTGGIGGTACCWLDQEGRHSDGASELKDQPKPGLRRFAM
jgi:hypothetical protein